MDPSPTVPAATSIPLTSVVPEVNFQTRNHDIKGNQPMTRAQNKFYSKYKTNSTTLHKQEKNWPGLYFLRSLTLAFMLFIAVGNNTTVISVRGSGSSKDNTNNENDKTVANNAHGVNERTSSFNKDDLENPVS